MPKVFEFGYSRVTFDHPANKVPSIVQSADKMSEMGWEFKTMYDGVSEVYLFFQREKEVAQISSAPPPPATDLTSSPLRG